MASIDFALQTYTPLSGNAVNFELGAEVLPAFPLGFCVSGKLGKEEWDDPLGVYGIYQMRMTKRGKVPIKMKFYGPTNPETEAQQANRQKFADAMTAWGNLTEQEKQTYTIRAKKRQMFGWGFFIREYFRNN